MTMCRRKCRVPMFRRSLSSRLWMPITDPIANRIINQRSASRACRWCRRQTVDHETGRFGGDRAPRVAGSHSPAGRSPAGRIRMTRRLRNLRGNQVRRRSHIRRRTGSRSVNLRRRLSSPRHRCISQRRHRRHHRYISLRRLRQRRRNVNLLRRRSRMSGSLTIVRGASRNK